MVQNNSNKVAWITGASSGIGHGLALKMAAEGWHVGATARSAPKLESLAQKSRELAGSIRAFPADVTDSSLIEETLQNIEKDLGKIDLAVLNAGTYLADDATSLSNDQFTELLDLNVNGTVYCLNAILRSMQQRNTGHIAIVSSLAGYGGLPRASAYGASKAALINLTESLRPELERAGIKLQLVNPGFVKTPLTDKNDFEMPFLMDLEPAIAALYDGLMSDRFEITFPRRFALMMKLMKLLPYGLYFRLTRRLLDD